jgi:predicted PurR-regulated permease PerM
METKNGRKISVAVNFAAFVIIIAGIIEGALIVTPLLMALFISIICAQPIVWLQNRKVPQVLAIAIVFVLIMGIFFGFGKLISSSLSSFSDNVALYEQNLNEMGNKVLHFFENKHIDVSTEKMAELFAPSKVMGLTAEILGSLGSLMGDALTIFFLVIFLLFEIDSISVKLKAILSNSTLTLSYFNTIGASIRHYLSIKTFTSLLTGVLIWIALAIVGVDYAIIWGLIAFLLNYIPNIGSIIAAIPAVLFSIVQMGFGGAIWTTAIFVTVNMIIGNAVEPKMMGKGMGLSTFIVFVSLIFWGFVLGTVGMFLSVPLTMAIKIMLEQKESTRWVAIMLGTEDDARAMIEERESIINKT